MFTLISGNYIPQLQTVDNGFIQQVYSLGVNSAKQGKFLTVNTKNYMSNRGEIADKKIKLQDKSVMNLANLSPLTNVEGVKNLKEEIALYRLLTLGLKELGNPQTYIKNDKNSEFLLMDYLLSSSLCYVEVFDGGGKVNKFYATRNRFIAASIAGVPATETSKYIDYLMPDGGAYRNKHLRILRLNRNKDGFKISKPKLVLDFGTKTIRVLPLFLVAAFMEGLSEVLKDKILEFTYLKDNGTERQLTTTLSSKILKNYYEPERADFIISNILYKIDRGYIKVPELGLSKYDGSGVRSINLARVTSIREVEEVERTFINVDFNSIIPTFKVTLEGIRDINMINIIYQSLLNEVPTHSNIAILKSDINSYVDTNYAMTTTTFQKRMHKYMLQYSMIFKNYTGKKVEYVKSDDFNLGVG